MFRAGDIKGAREAYTAAMASHPLDKRVYTHAINFEMYVPGVCACVCTRTCGWVSLRCVGVGECGGSRLVCVCGREWVGRVRVYVRCGWLHTHPFHRPFL